MLAHGVVDTTAGQQDVRVVTHGLSFLDQVIRVYANAVTTDQAGLEGQKVPLGASCFQHLVGVDAKAPEDEGKFVDQGDVGVALGVFNHLGGFSHLDTAGFMRSGGDDAAVQRIYKVGGRRCGTGGDFWDGGEAALLVARVDSLGAITYGEVLIEF